LLSPAAIVNGQIVVEDTSSRNCNRRVSRLRGANYFLKQSTGEAHHATMKREAEIYLSLNQIPEIAPHLIRFFCYDSEENVLVLEYLRDVKDLSRHLAEGGQVSNTISRSMGDVLGLLHRIDLSQLMGDAAMHSEPPWILSIHRPSLQSLRDVSPANLELIRMVQATPAISERLDELRAAWQPAAMVHMDIRWNNWLIRDPELPPEASLIKLLDWETACVGDPRWDIGCGISDHLLWWALQIPENGGEASSRYADKDITPVLHRILRSFWRQYCIATNLKSAHRASFLSTALEYAGARLIQTAYERLQRSQDLDRFGVSLLQLSANILQFPQAAAETLCGFELEHA